MYIFPEFHYTRQREDVAKLELTADPEFFTQLLCRLQIRTDRRTVQHLSGIGLIGMLPVNDDIDPSPFDMSLHLSSQHILINRPIPGHPQHNFAVTVIHRFDFERNLVTAELQG
ncbi:hypothetical protein D3C85_1375020 [compost metagenome]